MWARRAAMYRQGMTLREIAEREGVTAASVLVTLRKAGVQMRRACPPPGPRPIPYLAQAVRLRREGLTLAQIGAVVGRTAEAVRQALTRAPGDSAISHRQVDEERRAGPERARRRSC